MLPFDSSSVGFMWSSSHLIPLILFADLIISVLLHSSSQAVHPNGEMPAVFVFTLPEKADLRQQRETFAGIWEVKL